MEIHQIKYFIQICKDKSFSKAAKNINISQQGLSKVINKLENELGVQLFYRSSKGVTVTEFGDILLKKSQAVVNEFDLMTEFLYDRAKIEKGTIYLGLPEILYSNFFANMICEFQEKYPDIKLRLVESGSYICEKNMEERLVDISLAVQPVNTKKFKFIPVCTSNIMLLVNKENYLVKESNLCFNDLKNEKFIMLSSEYKSRHLVNECCSQSNFTPNIIFETSQVNLIIELVALNKGIAALPECILSNATKINDKVSIVSFKYVPLRVEMGLIIDKYKKLNYITNTFINHTIKFFKDK